MSGFFEIVMRPLLGFRPKVHTPRKPFLNIGSPPLRAVTARTAKFEFIAMLSAIFERRVDISSRSYKKVMAMINAIGAPVSVVAVNSAGRFIGLGMNSLAEEFIGISNESFKGRDLENFAGISNIRRSIAQRTVSNFRQCIELRSPIVGETKTELEDGASVWGRHTIIPIFNKFGKICRLMSTSINITELKKTQEKLENALTRVLSGFVTICATCKDIKENSDQWVRVERYLDNDVNNVQFSHGYCLKCYESAVQALK